MNHFTVQVVHRGALHGSSRGDWALQLVQEMLGYQLEHLLVCTCGCAIPVIIVALQLHVWVAIVHVEPPLECGSDF